MTHYHLTVWRHGQKFYAQGYPSAQFTTQRGAADEYTRQETVVIRRRFRKVKLALKLEEVVEAAAAPSRASEPISDQAKKLLMFE